MIAIRLRQTREISAANQAQWCRRIGIGYQTWNNYERGVSRINLDAALKVVRAVGIGLDWIYRGEEAMLPDRFVKALAAKRMEEAQRLEEAEEPPCLPASAES